MVLNHTQVQTEASNFAANNCSNSEKRESRSKINEILPRPAPSANTALNILTSNHNQQLAGLQAELTTIRERENADQAEITRLQAALDQMYES